MGRLLMVKLDASKPAYCTFEVSYKRVERWEELHEKRSVVLAASSRDTIGHFMMLLRKDQDVMICEDSRGSSKLVSVPGVEFPFFKVGFLLDVKCVFVKVKQEERFQEWERLRGAPFSTDMSPDTEAEERWLSIFECAAKGVQKDGDFYASCFDFLRRRNLIRPEDLAQCEKVYWRTLLEQASLVGEDIRVASFLGSVFEDLSQSCHDVCRNDLIEPSDIDKLI